MDQPPAFTSADAQRKYMPGRLMYLGDGPEWKDILVEVHSRNLNEKRMLVPAVAEPQIIWQLSGTVMCEERELDGEWSAHLAKPGELFLTTSPRPYELRWKTLDHIPLTSMHVFIGIPLLARAAADVLGEDAGLPLLKEANCVDDPLITSLLEQLRSELVDRPTASRLVVQGVAQSLAVHLVRNYRDDSSSPNNASQPANVLPAYRFRKVETMMEENLEQGVQISDLAKVAEMSESHFSRMFKGTTGLSPMQYFIRLRMMKAQQLLRETAMSIIEIGLEVGYTNPSHFAQVFRKETAQTPKEYRQGEPHAIESSF